MRIKQKGANSTSENSLEYYLNSIDKYTLLKADEELALVTGLAKDNLFITEQDRFIESLSPSAPEDVRESYVQSPAYLEVKERIDEARSRLFNANLRLVVNRAGKYMGLDDGRIMDVIQEGNMGLMRATEKYDPSKINPKTIRPYKFSTYAVWWIDQGIRRYLEKDKVVHIPEYLQKKNRRIKSIVGDSTYDELTEQQIIDISSVIGFKCSDEGLLEKVYDAVTMAKCPYKAVSLDEISSGKSSFDEQSTGSIIDTIEADNPHPFDNLRNGLIRKHFVCLLAELGRGYEGQIPKEADSFTNQERVLRLRYGIEDGKYHTQSEVKDLMGVTKQRVSQIEAIALENLGRIIRRHLNFAEFRDTPDPAQELLSLAKDMDMKCIEKALLGEE